LTMKLDTFVYGIITISERKDLNFFFFSINLTESSVVINA